MNIRTYREMYDHIEASGEQKKKIFNEILDADESKMWENKNLHILMAAIVVIALVVILPVGGYAAQKLNTHFTYSVQKPGKDHKAVLHIKKKYGEILGYEYTMEKTNKKTLAKYIRNAHPNYFVKLSVDKKVVGDDYILYKHPDPNSCDVYAMNIFQYKGNKRWELLEKAEHDSKKGEKIRKKYYDRDFCISVYYVNRSKDIEMTETENIKKMTIGGNEAYYFKGIGAKKGQTKKQKQRARDRQVNTIWIFDKKYGYCIEITGEGLLPEKKLMKIAQTVRLEKTTRKNSMEFSVISAHY